MRSLLLATTITVLAASPAFAAPQTAADVEAANGKAFAAALAKRQLVVLPLQERVREHAEMTAPKPTAGNIDLVITAGWRGEEVLFVSDGHHGVYRVRRAPHVAATIEEHLGCRQFQFAGGRGWFVHVRYALAKGDTYRGEVTVPYDVTSWVTVDATTQPDGTQCPKPGVMLD
jgi:hypothetical protein